MFFKKFFYKKINSTNDIAIKKIKQNFKAGIIITSEQKKGRGQHGRRWISRISDSDESVASTLFRPT